MNLLPAHQRQIPGQRWAARGLHRWDTPRKVISAGGGLAPCVTYVELKGCLSYININRCGSCQGSGSLNSYCLFLLLLTGSQLRADFATLHL